MLVLGSPSRPSLPTLVRKTQYGAEKELGMMEKAEDSF